MRATTRIILINKITDKAIIVKNKGYVSRMFNIPLATINNWFRDGNNRVVIENYIIYKPEGYIIE